jgi:hypothetical protein
MPRVTAIVDTKSIDDDRDVIDEAILIFCRHLVGEIKVMPLIYSETPLLVSLYRHCKESKRTVYCKIFSRCCPTQWPFVSDLVLMLRAMLLNGIRLGSYNYIDTTMDAWLTVRSLKLSSGRYPATVLICLVSLSREVLKVIVAFVCIVSVS